MSNFFVFSAMTLYWIFLFSWICAMYLSVCSCLFLLNLILFIKTISLVFQDQSSNLALQITWMFPCLIPYAQFFSGFSCSITKIVNKTIELGSDPAQILVGPHGIVLPAWQLLMITVGGIFFSSELCASLFSNLV